MTDQNGSQPSENYTEQFKQDAGSQLKFNFLKVLNREKIVHLIVIPCRQTSVLIHPGFDCPCGYLVFLSVTK